MKTPIQITSSVLALCGLFVSCLIVKADKPVPLPTFSSTSGAWIGYGDHKCIRLELDEDGTGYLSMARLLNERGEFLPNIGTVYRVTKWQPQGYRITAELKPLRDDHDGIVLTNSYLGMFSLDMDLEIIQGTQKWKATLYREAEPRARVAKMKEGIDVYRKKDGRK